MSGFLSDLGARAVSDAAVARPRPRSLFEPEGPATAVPPVPGAARLAASDLSSPSDEPPRASDPAADRPSEAGIPGTADPPQASATVSPWSGESPGNATVGGAATSGSETGNGPGPTPASAVRAVSPAFPLAPAVSAAPVVQRRGADRPAGPAARPAEAMPASAANPPPPAAAAGDGGVPDGPASRAGAAAPPSVGGVPPIAPPVGRSSTLPETGGAAEPPPADRISAIDFSAAAPAPSATAGTEGGPSAPAGEAARPARPDRPAVVASVPESLGAVEPGRPTAPLGTPQPAFASRRATAESVAGPPAPPPATTAPAETPSETVVEVRIGRIEVRVDQAARRPAAPSSPQPPISLADYLGGRGRR